MTKKFKNDTTLTRQGDNYQYIVAFECCINAKEGDIIYIEQRGDVATGDTSFETKHHSGEEHKISDNHEDFWKTLKNWVVNYDVIKSYKYLILFTTSDIYAKSKLSEWNKSDRTNKLQIITEIKENGVPNTIKDFVNKVFEYNNVHTQNILLEILEKFSISDNQPVIQNKIEEVLQHPFFSTIPKNNRRGFLNMLLGEISAQGRDNPDDWKINITEFKDFVSYNARHYTSNTQPIPDLYKGAFAETDNYADYPFVKDMKEVELDGEVRDAINDYFRATSTVTHLLQNDPFVNQKLSDYQDDVILKDINYLKEELGVDIVDKNDKPRCIKQSKKCYFQAMRIPLKLVEGYDPNHEFFQRGTIHSLVNSNNNDFSWKYKGEETDGL